MLSLETCKKQAKLLVRWHREGNYSIGGRIRGLPRYRYLTDREALALKFPLSEAQEIIALEAGYQSWAELKAALARKPSPRPEDERTPGPSVQPVTLKTAIPLLYVRDVKAAAEFYRDSLGFRIDFLHGHPAFYGAVSRDGACLHLRFVHEPAFVPGVAEREELIMAFLVVDNLKGLYSEYLERGVVFSRTLRKEAWGGSTFIVQDPDGNLISFTG